MRIETRESGGGSATRQRCHKTEKPAQRPSCFSPFSALPAALARPICAWNQAGVTAQPAGPWVAENEKEEQKGRDVSGS